MWSIIVPVKRSDLAKTRFSRAPRQWRAALARALAADTVEVLLSVPVVDAVLVVTDDAVVTTEVTGMGARVIADTTGGLNASLRHGAAALGTGEFLASLPADLPALRGADLRMVLGEALRVDSAFVADISGEGTTLLTARRSRHYVPRYGAGSAKRHLAGGAVSLISPPSLRLDVDGPADLRAALAMGAGPRTRAVAGDAPALVPPLPAR